MKNADHVEHYRIRHAQLREQYCTLKKVNRRMQLLNLCNYSNVKCLDVNSFFSSFGQFSTSQ